MGCSNNTAAVLYARRRSLYIAALRRVHSFSTPHLTAPAFLHYNPLVILFSKPVDWFRFIQLSQLFLLEKGEQK